MRRRARHFLHTQRPSTGPSDSGPRINLDGVAVKRSGKFLPPMWLPKLPPRADSLLALAQEWPSPLKVLPDGTDPRGLEPAGRNLPGSCVTAVGRGTGDRVAGQRPCRHSCPITLMPQQPESLHLARPWKCLGGIFSLGRHLVSRAGKSGGEGPKSCLPPVSRSWAGLGAAAWLGLVPTSRAGGSVAVPQSHWASHNQKGRKPLFRRQLRARVLCWLSVCTQPTSAGEWPWAGHEPLSAPFPCLENGDQAQKNVRMNFSFRQAKLGAQWWTDRTPSETRFQFQGKADARSNSDTGVQGLKVVAWSVGQGSQRRAHGCVGCGESSSHSMGSGMICQVIS